MAKLKKVTIEQVKSRIFDLKAYAEMGDWERAQSTETELYKDVLHTIKQASSPGVVLTSKSMSDAEMSDLAAEALKASKIKFTRVTA